MVNAMLASADPSKTVLPTAPPEIEIVLGVAKDCAGSNTDDPPTTRPFESVATL